MQTAKRRVSSGQPKYDPKGFVRQRLRKKSPSAHLYIPTVEAIANLFAALRNASPTGFNKKELYVGPVFLMLTYMAPEDAVNTIYYQFKQGPAPIISIRDLAARIRPTGPGLFKIVQIRIGCQRDTRFQGKGFGLLFMLRAAQAAGRLGCRLMVEQTNTEAASRMGRKLMSQYGWIPDGPVMHPQEISAPYHHRLHWARSYLSPV